MPETLFQPKPWLDLLKTNFLDLRLNADRLINNPTDHPTRDNKSPRQSDPESPHQSDTESTPESTPSFDALSLPSEVLRAIFARLEPEHLSAAAQVCQKWLSHAYEPYLWRRIAHRTWPSETSSNLERKLYKYKTWRKLATQRPRLRTNAIYVTRHQFAKTASRVATSEPSAPVFLVTYHRFLRFYTDGTVVALTTPDSPDISYRRVRRDFTLQPHDRDKAAPSIGTYELDEDALVVRVTLPMTQPKFPAMRTGTMYMTFSLAETVAGACNRLCLTEHYAVMDHDGGDLVSYNPDSYAGRPFRLVPLLGFRQRVFREFPRDDQRDLAQWAEMKRASRVARRQRGE